ncbi:MAG: patatin family protein, partial [Bacilli bacterium]|nr:patatin family protein [Bacilli bacterium]
SKIVSIRNKKYLDGGISDSIPIEKAMELGYDKIIVVLTRSEGYQKKIKKRNLLTLIYRKYPNFQKTILERPKKYNETLEKIKELEKNHKIFVLRPSKKIPIKRIEKRKEIIKEQYLLGKKDILDNFEELMKYLGCK